MIYTNTRTHCWIRNNVELGIASAVSGVSALSALSEVSGRSGVSDVLVVLALSGASALWSTPVLLLVSSS